MKAIIKNIFSFRFTLSTLISYIIYIIIIFIKSLLFFIRRDLNIFFNFFFIILINTLYIIIEYKFFRIYAL